MNPEKNICAVVILAVMLAGMSCAKNPDMGAVAPLHKTPSIVLDQKKKAILTRITDLLKESKHWNEEHPLRSVTFDEKRSQWAFVFSTLKPDDGIVAYITDENADRIDIQLFPGVWTKFETKRKPSNHTSDGIRQPADGSPKPSM
jgi:hypothetical protein